MEATYFFLFNSSFFLLLLLLPFSSRKNSFAVKLRAPISSGWISRAKFQQRIVLNRLCLVQPVYCFPRLKGEGVEDLQVCIKPSISAIPSKCCRCGQIFSSGLPYLWARMMNRRNTEESNYVATYTDYIIFCWIYLNAFLLL